MMNAINIKRISLEPAKGACLDEVLKHAENLAYLFGCTVQFYFNEHEIIVTGSSNLDIIVKDYLEFQAKKFQPEVLNAKG